MKTEQRTEQQEQRREQAPQAQKDHKVDGVDQVFQMLKIADPAFRESLLQRLSTRDIELARTLKAKLLQAGIRV